MKIGKTSSQDQQRFSLLDSAAARLVRKNRCDYQHTLAVLKGILRQDINHVLLRAIKIIQNGINLKSFQS